MWNLPMWVKRMLSAKLLLGSWRVLVCPQIKWGHIQWQCHTRVSQGKSPGRNTFALAAGLAVKIGNNKIIYQDILTALLMRLMTYQYPTMSSGLAPPLPIYGYFSGLFNFHIPQQLQPHLYSYRDMGCIKIFVVSCRKKSTIIYRYSGLFSILFYAENGWDLIVLRPDPYFSFLDLHRNFNLFNSCTVDTFY